MTVLPATSVLSGRCAYARSRVPAGAAGDAAIQLLADAGLAPVVLTIITVIAVYKPWGLTPLAKGTPAAQPLGAQRWSLRVLVAAIIAFVVGFVTLHLTGRSLHHSHGH